MKFSTSIIITLLSVVALGAELAMYAFFGIGAAFSGSDAALSGTAAFFVGLMILTAVAGIGAPVSALVELVSKKQNSGIYTFLLLLGLATIVVVGSMVSGKMSTPPVTAATDSKTVSTGGSETAGAEVSESDLENDAYLKKILLKNITVGKTILDEDGVFGEVKNTGQRTLKEVQITVYALGKDGDPVWDDDFYPVLDSKMAFGDSADPLKPNYSRKFGYKLEAPSDWNKRVKVVVTKVEFADDGLRSSDAPEAVTIPKAALTPQSSDIGSTWKGERYPQTRNGILTETAIAGWSFSEVRYALNEMYARHGYDFETPEVRKQFRNFSWFQPIAGRSQSEAESYMNETEKSNLRLLSKRRGQLSN